MAITNYTELQAAVANWLHRSDLTSRIPEFIALGEAYLNREIKHPAMNETATVSTSTANRFAAFPTATQKILAVIDPYGEPLRLANDVDVTAMSVGASSGLPEIYAITDQIEFNRISDQVYSMSVQYQKKLRIATDSTNWLLTDYPDAYLYAALFAAMPFIKDDQRLQLIKPMLDEVISEVKRSGKNRVSLRVDDALIPSSQYNISRGY